MLINTRDIQAFIAVVETGSLVAAATRLNITQPAVTRRIQSLENALRAVLLDRQSKPLRPTKAGQQAYELGRRVLLSVEDLAAGVMPGDDVSGEFRMGVSSWLAETSLASTVDLLHARYPRLQLRVSTGWSSNLLAQVEANALDLAAIFLPAGRMPPEALGQDRLATWQASVVADRRIEFSPRPSLRELAGHRWILNPDGCGFRRAIQRVLETHHLPFDLAVEVSGAELQLSLIARGIGLGLFSSRILANSCHADAVQLLDVPELSFDMNVWLVYKEPAGRFAGAIAAVRDLLRESVAGEAAESSPEAVAPTVALPA